MAKVTGALLSLGARGQIGKALVFSNWKGIGTARQHVVPANPQTAGQITQRTRMTDVVACWKQRVVEAELRTGWNLAASLGATVQSGFNAFTSAMATEAADEPAFCVYDVDLVDPGTDLKVVSYDQTASIAGGVTIERWLGLTAKSLALIDTKTTVGGAATETFELTPREYSGFVQFRVAGVAISGIMPCSYSG